MTISKSSRPVSSSSRAVAPAKNSPNLTAREKEVMRWICEGKRDREIATILGLSHRTVEKHVCHILEKLGVETRTAAARHVALQSERPPPRRNSSPLMKKKQYRPG